MIRPSMAQPLLIGESPLAIADVVAVARARRPVALAAGVAERVAAGRRALEAVASHDPPTYGVNTGFGHLASVRIDVADQSATSIRTLARCPKPVLTP